MHMNSNLNRNSMNHLCPRIIDSSNNHISFGGNQFWLARNTAACGGCGPVSAANIFATYARNNPEIARELDLSFQENQVVTQEKYTALLTSIYNAMRIREIPILSRLYDIKDRGSKFFSRFTPNLGIGIRHYSRGVLRFGLKHNILLQKRSLPTLLCGYTRGITFIKLALANGYPVTLLTTFNAHPLVVFDHPHLYDGRNEIMKKHFITITDIRESKSTGSPELIATSWGKNAIIPYADLYKSWQSMKALGSGMVYFIPAKNKRVTKKSILKCWKL